MAGWAGRGEHPSLTVPGQPVAATEGEVLGLIIGMILIGAIAGYIGRFLMPGPDPMGCLGTVALGIVGSFVGGTLAALLFGEGFRLNTAGILGSIIGVLIVLFIMRQTRT
jgi:uncharacterized membrane protein YeaQ/YmgE (transglycosylase-associated protein family)